MKQIKYLSKKMDYVDQKSLCGHCKRSWKGTTEEMSLEAFPAATVSDGADVTFSGGRVFHS